VQETESGYCTYRFVCIDRSLESPETDDFPVFFQESNASVRYKV
jgi:hypothetical protein